MGNFGGAVLRFGGLFLRALQLCCGAIILGIFSYFLAVLKDHNLPIYARWKAVEGISGAAVVYSIAACLLILCLGGVAFFGFLAVVLDVLFIGGFIAIAWFTRHGSSSCSGSNIVETPLGTGPANANAQGYSGDFGFGRNDYATYFPRLHYACRLNTVSFALSIIACFLFAISAAWSVAMVKHHKKEKAYGPSPANGYTKGSGRRPFWRRNKATHPATRDAEAATAIGASRPSHETGTTIGNGAGMAEPKYGEPGYGQVRSNAGHF